MYGKETPDERQPLNAHHEGRPQDEEGGEYHDIPMSEEAAKAEASQYTDSLTEEQKSAEMRDGIQMAALLVLGLLGLGFMLVYLDFVLVPLVFSRFLVYIFQPFINFIVGKKALPLCKARLKLPRWLAVVIVLILLVIIFLLLGLIIGMTVADVIEDADKYKQRANDLIDDLVKFAEDFGYTREEIEAMIPEIDVGALAVSVLNQAIGIITQMALVLLIVVYMLLGYDGSNKSELRAAIDVRIRKYITIHTFNSILTGIGTWLILVVFGVPFSMFNGLMAFVLNYIPNLGSVLGVVLPLPFVVFKDDFQLWELLAVAAALTICQFLLGQVLEPKMLGDAMDIPAITVICALLFWGSLWGIIGALLSVPLTVAVQLYLDSIDHPASKALAGMIIGDFSMFDKSPPRSNNKEEGKDKKKKKKKDKIKPEDLELGVPADEGQHFEQDARYHGGYGATDNYYGGGYGDDRYPPYGYEEDQSHERQSETKKRRGGKA